MTDVVNFKKWIMWINLWKTFGETPKLRVNSRIFDRDSLLSRNTFGVYFDIFGVCRTQKEKP